MEIQQAAEREVKRMEEILPNVSAKPNGEDLLSFARNYAQDSKFFLKREEYVEAFEAAVIAWAYIDIGIKLNKLSVPDSFKKYFTS